MIISDQNIQFSARHYAMSESKQERVYETYQNGQLASRESVRISDRNERFSASEPALALNKTPPKPQLPGHTNQQSATVLNPRNQTDSEQRALTASGARQSLTQTTSQHSMHASFQTFATNGHSQSVGGRTVSDDTQLSPRLLKMIEVIESLMERMTGKPFTIKLMGYPQPATADSAVNNQSQSPTTSTTSSPLSEFSSIAEKPELGERIVETTSYREQESLRFSAKGSVTMADGQRLDFALNTSMSRSFETSMQVQQTKGLVLTDPLVVNFGGNPAQLTLDKIDFDLDSDGKQDRISFLEAGSGFLVLDKNQDGKVNNGQELFGTQSGNGFKDLSQYDSDNNGWIDEKDPIFSQLQIWHRDQNGLEQLSGLLELNIGAIYLQSEETQFSLKDNQNNLQGQVVSSGIFIGEDQKSVGSVQQIDLVI